MRFFYLCLIAMFSLSACTPAEKPQEEEAPPLVATPVSYSELHGWGQDQYAEIVPAFQKSCARIMRQDPASKFGPLAEAGTYGDWQVPCVQFLAMNNADSQSVRGFFERYFQPYQISAGNEPQGLFTGYYEASLKGSRTKSAATPYPLHIRPDDLVMVQLGDFREELKGQRIAGRVVGGNLKPYETRAQIVQGQWPHNDEGHVLVWVSNPVDAFFVQIQGSGRVDLDDGSVMRIGYAGQNGHPYYAIGRELIARGYLTKDEVSMQSIRDWLEAHPQEGHEIMDTNKSYVFFRELTDEGPIGGEGLALTPMRSLAVDRSLLPYGLPLWVNISAPKEGTPSINRMMIAQDTGGAIRGPVRGDVFWGAGDYAENMAGVMKSQGRYWALLPKQQGQ